MDNKKEMVAGCVPPVCQLNVKYIIRLHGQDIELTELEAEELCKLLNQKFPPKTTWSVLADQTINNNGVPDTASLAICRAALLAEMQTR